MVDTLTPAERSKRMSLIRSSNTAPELRIRKELHGLGLRYRLGNKQLPGKPDLVFPRHNTAVFVHGCFWHNHEGCKVGNMPKSNTGFWAEKFKRNSERDRRTTRELELLGWRVLVVWECELGPKQVAETALKLADRIRG